MEFLINESCEACDVDIPPRVTRGGERIPTAVRTESGLLVCLECAEALKPPKKTKWLW